MANVISQVKNTRHSMALVEIGGEFVVSCLETDSDDEVFVRSFTDRAIAERVFNAQSRLLACSASEMNLAVDRVYYCLSSLKSCLHREVPNEARMLVGAMKDLELAKLKRNNPTAELRKRNVLYAAKSEIARRAEDLDLKIATESEARELRGQP